MKTEKQQEIASVTSVRVKGVVMPHDSKTLQVAFFFLDGDRPFICGATGWVTTETLTDIETAAMEYKKETFTEGDGEYLFDATRIPGQYGDEGRCELPPYWDLRLLAYRKLEDEAQQGLVATSENQRPLTCATK